MTRYTRHTPRSRRCKGKQQHASRGDAVRVRERLVAEGAFRQSLMIYPCRDHWHIGRISGRWMRAAA
jgi:hypothetical protein